mmetsp:Transcript_89304/g.251369  ORF Transcript_89304/g.251369 Transcript_89304/m.251369 type:complete len:654 (-) Transcript_89304:112-2073(-)
MQPPAAPGGVGTTPAMDHAMAAPSVSKEMQVKHLLKLLQARGEKAANEFRTRIVRGQGVTARGVAFSAATLQEALDEWIQATANTANASGNSKGDALRQAQQQPATAPDANATKLANGAPQGSPSRKRKSMSSASLPLATGGVGSNFANPAATTRLPRSKAAKTSTAAADSSHETSANAVPPRRLKPVASIPKAPAPPEHVASDIESAPRRRSSVASSPASLAPAVPTAPATSNETPAPASTGTASAGAPPADSNGTAASSVGTGATPPATKSIKDLKAGLVSNGLDISGCVEKADLEALWQRFEDFRALPLAELRAAFDASVGNGTRPTGRPTTADEFARYLASRPVGDVSQASCTPRSVGSTCEEAAPAPPAAARPRASPAQPAAAGPQSDAGRQSDEVSRSAAAEIVRVLAIRRESYASPAAWGFAVLGCGKAAVPEVQRQYRLLMKKLHPDKVGHVPGIERAVEFIREAKDLCERKLSRVEAPCRPRELRYMVLCADHGSRRIRLEWSPPIPRDGAPIRRYIIAAFDPSYGRALTVTVLEPDYSQQLQRYVSVEELDSFVFAEEELQKMPSLFRQTTAELQVAAANEAGQSEWSRIIVPLTPAVRAAPGAAQVGHIANSVGPAAGRCGVSCGLQASSARNVKGNRKRPR